MNANEEVLIEYVKRVQEVAAERERKAIVDWLIKGANAYAEAHIMKVEDTSAYLYATMIERGEHHE